MTTTIITGTEPKIERKGLTITLSRESRDFSDAHIRRQYSIPPQAVDTVTPHDNYDLDDHHYVWFEVTC